MFYFILHPLQWLDHTQASLIFSCRRMAHGAYEVSWAEGDKTKSAIYDTEDVMEALAKRWWIMSDEQGEY